MLTAHMKYTYTIRTGFVQLKIYGIRRSWTYCNARNLNKSDEIAIHIWTSHSLLCDCVFAFFSPLMYRVHLSYAVAEMYSRLIRLAIIKIAISVFVWIDYTFIFMSAHKYKLLEMDQFNTRRDRFALIFGVVLVLLTLFLIIDIQVGLNLTHNYSETYDAGVIRGDSELDMGDEKNGKQRTMTFP